MELEEFEFAVKNSGQKVMCVMYYFCMPNKKYSYEVFDEYTMEEKVFDDLKKEYKNVHMYKVNTYESVDIKRKYAAEGKVKPRFKFYKTGVIFNEIEYVEWSKQEIELISALAECNDEEYANSIKVQVPEKFQNNETKDDE